MNMLLQKISIHSCSLFFLLAAFIITSLAVEAASNPEISSSHDTSQPVEINADMLDVFQEESRAVFSGNVVAIQGDVRLKSDKMNVFYSSASEDNKALENQGSIEKIEVNGNVFLSTPEETASGEFGVYDLKKGNITLHNNVVLTRENNVLKGDVLVYNFNTGKSTITGGVTTTTYGKKKGRVRALFIPNKEKE